ncbi:hypothetical protein ACH4UR_37380 [Streptomyces lydicus]|uniref:hypothetical protein n=1 Tax=Streptomyces lydicus TaxID=47763 RepID=UPI0034045EDD
MSLTTALTAFAWTGAAAAPLAAIGTQFMSNKALVARQLAIFAVLHTLAATVFLALMTRELRDNDSLMALVMTICSCVPLSMAVVDLNMLHRERRQRSASRRAPDTEKSSTSRQLATFAGLYTLVAIMFLTFMARDLADNDTLMALLMAVCASVQLTVAITSFGKLLRKRRQRSAARPSPHSDRNTLGRS